VVLAAAVGGLVHAAAVAQQVFFVGRRESARRSAFPR
jgi:hypothetical protein